MAEDRADQPIARTTRVGLLNNYPMDVYRRSWAAGVYPEHLIWSGPRLEAAGYDVRYLPYGPGAFSRSATRLTRLRFGEPGPQLAMLRSGADVFYVGTTRTLAGLGLLRRAGLLRRPILAIENSAVPDYALYRHAVLGYDIVIAHSPPIHRDLIQLGRDPERTVFAPWGPDLGFAGYDEPTSTEHIVSSGKTRRDLAVLLDALAQVDFPAVVYGTAPGPVPDGVTMVPQVKPFEESIQDLRRAAVIAIPLADTSSPNGISELNDALALGKPVVATRSANIGFDIEEVGCGIWVDAGDRQGWVAALEALLGDPSRRAAMGAAGRRFAQDHWNAELFGAAVVAAVGRLAQGVA